MILIRNIEKYCVYSSGTIIDALKVISKNQSRICFIVNESGKLEGALSDGDFRRWLTNSSDFNLNQAVISIANKKIIALRSNSSNEKIVESFSHKVDLIPLVDEFERIVALAQNKANNFTIGEHEISDFSKAFIIAEIGNNHNGSLELALKMIDLAKASGADCVKFQMRDVKSLYKSGYNDASDDLGAQYVKNLLSKYQLSNEDLIKAFNYCKKNGLEPLCTPWDLESLKVLENYGMRAYKVASADFTNFELLEALAQTAKPLICSTGMSSENEILKTTRFLTKRGANFCLLHCNSTYPTPYKDINLNYIKRLKEISGTIVGYSGHERGISVPMAAVTLGAKIIEKHFTLDRNMEGSDHKVSLLPEEFFEMVKQIRNIEESMGSASERIVTQGEMINRESLAKSIVAKIKIKKGQKITRDMLEIRSPGQGLQPCYIDDLIGSTAKKDFIVGDFFYDSDLKNEIIEARNYKFNRPFGIPVRYHDYFKLKKDTNLNFVEFHLSFQDMDLNIRDYIHEIQEIDFAVHSPELFLNDHIMDLCSTDEVYRLKSIDNLNNVCEVTRKLKTLFPKTKKPVIVINAGGFSELGFIEKENKESLYERIADSLSKVNMDGVEIIIQTMPPFPWHFGGQRYHNLFVDSVEIIKFCSEYGYRICFDLSHSMMACNYYGWEIEKFTKDVSPYIAHMHIVDAQGVDGEGVQIGKGDVNFQNISLILNECSPGVMFLPEVWQGHKNNGEGFWLALEYLERYF